MRKRDFVWAFLLIVAIIWGAQPRLAARPENSKQFTTTSDSARRADESTSENKKQFPTLSDVVRKVDDSDLTTPAATSSPSPSSSATTRPIPTNQAIKATTTTPVPRPTPTPVPTPTYSTLALGAKGDDVRELQERLAELGYAIGTADGQYGGKTEAAVRALQVLAGLRVTGVADEETQHAIWGWDAPTPQPRPTPTPKPTPRPTPEPEPEDAGSDYILNKNTGKFHYSWCSSVDQMKESNKIYFTGTSEQAQRKGYVPCKRCNP